MKDTDTVILKLGDALIIVDIQKDFLPGGSLAVDHGEQILPVLNDYIRLFSEAALPIYATRDWHPSDHCSFISQGGSWPSHCIAGTPGAEFADGLELPDNVNIVSKATGKDKDAYSGFEGTELNSRLLSQGIKRLFIGGLATDYCVLNTVNDALTRGYPVCLLKDAIRAIDPHDGLVAIDAMMQMGAMSITLKDFA